MVVKCIKATEQLDERVLTTLNKDVQDMFVQVDNPSMKEVKGIEDRLYGLDQILSSAAKVVQEQGDMAQVIINNMVIFTLIIEIGVNSATCNVLYCHICLYWTE